MATPLDISTFVYRTGTLTIAPGDTTAVFSGTALAASVKDGDTLCAGGVKVPIQTVTDDTHVELFTPWDGAAVTAGSYMILKDSLLRYHTALIGYDSASFLALLDGTTVWYDVEGDEPDPSLGEEGQRALKSNVTPWKVWLKTGGVWIEQAGSPGGQGDAGADGATWVVQTAEPGTDYPVGSLWLDADSADLDVYQLGGSPLAWEDTGVNLKGAQGNPGAGVPAGGTVGQVLARDSGTGTEWIDPPATGDVAGETHDSTSKTTPVDADELPIVDSEASNVLKKLTWGNLKAALAVFVGDSGTGGVKGIVPAPSSGDSAAGKFLKADGSWAVPPGSGATYATKSDMESASSTTVAVTPGGQYYHPAHSKAFYRANITPTVVSGNVSSENTTTEQITWSTNHGLSTGDVIIPDGGTWATGVTVGAAYYVNAVSATVFTLHILRPDADSGTNPVNLTATGSGTRTMKKIVHGATIGFGMQAVSPIGFAGGQTSIMPEASISGLIANNVAASSMTIQGIVNTSGNAGLGYVGVPSSTVGTIYSTLGFDTSRVLVMAAGVSPTVPGTWTQQGTTTMRFVFEIKCNY